jgi:hypothetical protein
VNHLQLRGVYGPICITSWRPTIVCSMYVCSYIICTYDMMYYYCCYYYFYYYLLATTYIMHVQMYSISDSSRTPIHYKPRPPRKFSLPFKIYIILIYYAGFCEHTPKGTDSYGQVLAFELTRRVLGHNGYGYTQTGRKVLYFIPCYYFER